MSAVLTLSGSPTVSASGGVGCTGVAASAVVTTEANPSSIVGGYTTSGNWKRLTNTGLGPIVIQGMYPASGWSLIGNSSLSTHCAVGKELKASESCLFLELLTGVQGPGAVVTGAQRIRTTAGDHSFSSQLQTVGLQVSVAEPFKPVAANTTSTAKVLVTNLAPYPLENITPKVTGTSVTASGASCTRLNAAGQAGSTCEIFLLGSAVPPATANAGSNSLRYRVLVEVEGAYPPVISQQLGVASLRGIQGATSFDRDILPSTVKWTLGTYPSTLAAGDFAETTSYLDNTSALPLTFISEATAVPDSQQSLVSTSCRGTLMPGQRCEFVTRFTPSTSTSLGPANTPTLPPPSSIVFNASFESLTATATLRAQGAAQAVWTQTPGPGFCGVNGKVVNPGQAYDCSVILTNNAYTAGIPVGQLGVRPPSYSYYRFFYPMPGAYSTCPAYLLKGQTCIIGFKGVAPQTKLGGSYIGGNELVIDGVGPFKLGEPSWGLLVRTAYQSWALKTDPLSSSEVETVRTNIGFPAAIELKRYYGWSQTETGTYAISDEFRPSIGAVRFFSRVQEGSSFKLYPETNYVPVTLTGTCFEPGPSLGCSIIATCKADRPGIHSIYFKLSQSREGIPSYSEPSEDLMFSYKHIECQVFWPSPTAEHEALVFEPDVLNMGTMPPGSKLESVLTLRNTGTKTLGLPGFGIVSGVYRSSFTLSNVDCPYFLGPQQSCKVKVLFTNTDRTDMTYSAQVSVASNSSRKTVVYARILPNPANLDYPEEIDFGVTEFGNSRNLPLGAGVQKISLSGDVLQETQGGFSATRSCDTCSFLITFKPRANRAYSADLTLQTTFGSKVIRLKGTGRTAFAFKAASHVPLPAVVGEYYSLNLLTMFEGVNKDYLSLTIKSGTVPPGLFLSGFNLSGVPTAVTAGPVSITFHAKYFGLYEAEGQLVLNVKPKPVSVPKQVSTLLQGYCSLSETLEYKCTDGYLVTTVPALKNSNVISGNCGAVPGAIICPSTYYTAGQTVPQADNVISLSAGVGHYCAVAGNNQTICWGSNSGGQLGDGSYASPSQAVVVQNLGPAIAVAAGEAYSCAVTTGGKVKCWGINGVGQLGTGTRVSSPLPVEVPGLTGATAISAGTHHACAVANAEVWCWGYNGLGQLGDGTTSERAGPVKVQGLGGAAVSVAAGADHTCAQTTAGVKCWGSNAVGQLGDGTTTSSAVPRSVIGIGPAARSLTASPYLRTCVVDAGVVKCWGSLFANPNRAGVPYYTVTPTPKIISGI